MRVRNLYLLPLMIAASGSVLAVEATKSPYDWTGVYVGGFVGGASSANTTSTEPYANRDGNFWNDPGANNNYSTNASFMGGGTVGYNWQVPKTPFLVGLEGEYGYLGMSGSNSDPNSATFNASEPSPLDNGESSTKIGSSYGYGLVGGRIGYAMDRALIYIKSGAVFTSTQSSYNDSNYNVSTSSKRNNDASYAIGGGVEYALPFTWSKNISIKTEYLYFGLNNNTTASFTPTDGNSPTYSSTTNMSGIHTAKFGVNYKF